jgi:hypothetical protein
MVYCMNQNAYYIRSADNGATFSAPVQVNSAGSVEFNMGERGPKLAVGNDGLIHVMWMDKWYSGAQVHVRYSRSTNGGLSFEPRKQVSNSYGVDGSTVCVDGLGHVLVFWHINVPSQTTILQATWMHWNRSSNNGVSFNTPSDTNVIISNFSALTCSMCMMRARRGADGNAYCVFRSADNNIRDFYVIKAGFTSNIFTAVRVNYDNWNINYCPMVGPELEIGNGGRQFCAYMSGGHVYWSVSDTAVTLFTQHVATPLNEADEIYPTAIQNHAGQVLFLWQVGPMSISDSATVKWAVYSSNGTFTGMQGTVGRTFSGTRATAFVGTDDNFYIVANVNPVTTSIRGVPAPTLSVYPVPAGNHVTVELFSDAPCTGHIQLLDISGKIVYDQSVRIQSGENVFRLPVQSHPAGNYFIIAELGGRFMSKSIHIQKACGAE